MCFVSDLEALQVRRAARRAQHLPAGLCAAGCCGCASDTGCLWVPLLPVCPDDVQVHLPRRKKGFELGDMDGEDLSGLPAQWGFLAFRAAKLPHPILPGSRQGKVPFAAFASSCCVCN